MEQTESLEIIAKEDPKKERDKPEITKNLIIGPGLDYMLKYESDSMLKKKTARDIGGAWAYGQILGLIGLASYAGIQLDPEIAQHMQFYELGLKAWALSTIVGGANIWGLPVGIIDRTYGLIKVAKQYLSRHKH